MISEFILRWTHYRANPTGLMFYLMIFTSNLETIRSKNFVCLDAAWINILIVEEAAVILEDSESSSAEDYSSNDMDVYSSSEMEEKECDKPLENDRKNFSYVFERNDSDGSLNVRKSELEAMKGKVDITYSIYCSIKGLDRTSLKENPPNRVDNISNKTAAM